MAKRQIRTTNNTKFKAYGRKNHFATAKTLEKFLDTPKGEAYMEQYYGDFYEIPFDDMSKSPGIPYWIDNYEDYVTGEMIIRRDFDNEYIENESGYYDRYKPGEYREINGKNYYYAGGHIGSEEIEIQAENNELFYYNIGSNFFRIWRPFPKTYIERNEEGNWSLLHDKKRLVSNWESYDKVKNHAEFMGKKVNEEIKLPKMYFDYEENKFVKD